MAEPLSAGGVPDTVAGWAPRVASTFARWAGDEVYVMTRAGRDVPLPDCVVWTETRPGPVADSLAALSTRPLLTTEPSIQPATTPVSAEEVNDCTLPPGVSVAAPSWVAPGAPPWLVVGQVV